MAIRPQPPLSLIGTSIPFQAMLGEVSRLAPLARPVVVTGERGTGKELVAARLHYLSGRWQEPLVKLNCAALPETLLDAELFGHEAGAFTGAQRRREGRFEAADGGTLFLDEIATAPLAVQEKILRAVEYGEIQRLGSSDTLDLDVRLICATNADLPALAEQGKFRADLLDRLAFAVVAIPPLRARRDDIPELAGHFALAMTGELGRDFFPGFAPDAIAALMDHSWPGNVRQLKNVVERAVAMAADPAEPVEVLDFDPFASSWRDHQTEALVTPTPTDPSGPSVAGFAEAVAEFERRLLADALRQCKSNQKRAAAALGLTYHQFRHLLRKHGLQPDRL